MIDIMTNEEKVTSLNSLRMATLASRKESYYKGSVQRFVWNYLSEIVRLRDELVSREYHGSPGGSFTLRERGHERYIRSSVMRDRVVRHSFCDYDLNPLLDPYLYWDNGASQRGKGVLFSRERFEEDVLSYYREFHTNQGWILLMDFSKYYDNIRHDMCKSMVDGLLPRGDSFSRWLLGVILEGFVVDVSYMTDEEYALCLFSKFDSIIHSQRFLEPSCPRGLKYMEKSLAIGDQTSQTLSVFYPTRIDNYVKTVCGVKRYGRYMDDSRAIHQSREFLLNVLDGVSKEADRLDIHMNARKTQIVPLSGNFKYLQRKYRLTDSGHLIKRINPERVAAERRRLKKYVGKEQDCIMSYGDIENAYKSWMGSHARYMSRLQRDNMNRLFDNLFIKPFVKGVCYGQGYDHPHGRDGNRGRAERKHLYRVWNRPGRKASPLQYAENAS